MDFFGITFQYPLVFILLIIPIVISFFPKKKGYLLSSYEDILKVYKKDSIYYKVFVSVLYIIFCLYIVLISNPKQYNTQNTVKKNGIDIAIVFDVSFSMEAADLFPSRIEVAKRVLSDFLLEVKTDRVGVILFAGRPFAGVPLTFDYSFLKSFVSQITTDIIDQRKTYLQGTAIGDGLILATKMLASEDLEYKGRQKIIILLTDGEANAGINPMLALKLLKEKSIKTYTIGVGGTQETTIETLDALGRKQSLEVGGIDEETLKTIAQETHGKYFRATSKNALEDIFKEIQKIEKKEIEIQQKVTDIEKNRRLSIAIVFLMLGVFFLIIFKKIRV